MSEPNIIILSYIVAFVLGLLSMRYNTVSKWCFWLFVPAAWLFATLRPKFFNLPHANHDGFINFYVKLYEGLSPEAMMAVIWFPFIFLAGRLAYFLYDVYFVRDYVESPRDRKARVRAMYGMDEFN